MPISSKHYHFINMHCIAIVKDTGVLISP